MIVTVPVSDSPWLLTARYSNESVIESPSSRNCTSGGKYWTVPSKLLISEPSAGWPTASSSAPGESLARMFAVRSISASSSVSKPGPLSSTARKPTVSANTVMVTVAVSVRSPSVTVYVNESCAVSAPVSASNWPFGS